MEKCSQEFQLESLYTPFQVYYLSKSVEHSGTPNVLGLKILVQSHFNMLAWSFLLVDSDIGNK